MHKILLTAAAMVFLILFGIQNSEHVPVTFVFGSPAKVRLVFLVLIAATFGFLLSYLQGLSRERKLKKGIRELTALKEPEIPSLPAVKVRVKEKKSG